MRGSVFPDCSCRDTVTGKPLHRRCPQLQARKKGHGSWFARYDAPRAPGGKRRQPVIGPFATKKEAEDELAAVLARLGAGSPVPDRQVTVADYLDAYMRGKVNLRPRTKATDQEAMDLYWKPALGHIRLTDLRDHHIADALAEVRKINRETAGDPSETLRRLLAARAEAEGGKRSTVALSAARIRRVTAPLNAALNAAARSGRITRNPCAGVELPSPARVRPMPWTPGREDAFRAALKKRIDAASAAGPLRADARQVIWADPDLRPSPVMVWLPAQTGRFLDHAEGERLYALFHLAAFAGPRRGELARLRWSDVSMDDGTVSVEETSEGAPKTDAGTRVVPVSAETISALRAWRKRQAADRLAWGRDWTDTGLVFTREDGGPVPAQWISVRFATLAYRAGLPPVRFHDLRHGAASLCKAAGVDTKIISALLGHSRSSFTDDTYVHVFPAVARAAAEAAAGTVPRSRRAGS